MPINPLSASLLQNIAAPQVPNMMNAVMQGRLGQQTIEANQMAQAQAQQQLDYAPVQQAQQTEQHEMQMENMQMEQGMMIMQSLTLDAVSMLKMDESQRKQFINVLKDKYKSNPEVLGEINTLEKADYNTQNEMLFEQLEVAKSLNLFGEPEKEKEPSRSAAYKYARDLGLEPGTPEFNAKMEEYQQRAQQGKKTDIDLTLDMQGKIDPGYRQDPETGEQSLIPGSPQAIEIMEKVVHGRRSTLAGLQKVVSIQDSVNQALEGLGSWTTGIPGVVTSQVPGTEAFSLAKSLDTLKANLSFDKIQDMREISPTGGALGQVSNRELGQLEKAIKPLEQKLDKKTLKAHLKKVQNHYKRWYENLLEYNEELSKLYGISLKDIEMPETRTDEVVATHPEGGEIMLSDIYKTMRKHNVSYDEVLRRIGVN